MKLKHQARIATGLIAAGLATALFGIPAAIAAGSPKWGIPEETATTCAQVLAQASGGGAAYNAKIALAANTNHFVSDLGQPAQVTTTQGNTVSVRVPVIYADRNGDGQFNAEENPVIVPGDTWTGKLHVCNNSKMPAKMHAYLINAKAGVGAGDVKDTTDQFYRDLTVNGRSFATLTGTDATGNPKRTELTPATGVDMAYGGNISLDLNFALPHDSIAGNRSGNNGAYAAGVRSATVDVLIELQGDDPTTTPPTTTPPTTTPPTTTPPTTTPTTTTPPTTTPGTSPPIPGTPPTPTDPSGPSTTPTNTVPPGDNNNPDPHLAKTGAQVGIIGLVATALITCGLLLMRRSRREES